MAATVLEALRRAGVRPARIRPALNRLAKEFGREYVLVARNLATDGTDGIDGIDGIDVLWDFSRTSEGQGLMEGGTGQMVMREIVEDYLQYLTWADDGYPQMLELRSCQPSKVVLDPYRAFGQPIYVGSRARVRDVANMLKVGEDPRWWRMSTESASRTSVPPHASSWATPPEFYADENVVTRSVRRLLTSLGYSIHIPGWTGQVLRGHRHCQAGLHGRRDLQEHLEHRHGKLDALPIGADEHRRGACHGSVAR